MGYRRHMRFLPFVTLAVVAALAACNDTPEQKPVEGRNAANYTAANIAPLAERSRDPAELDGAFLAAFPNPVARVGEDDYSFKPAALYRLKDNWVLLSEGTGPDCHACSGWLAVHYLRQTPEGFALVKGWNDAIPGTSFGGAPQWTLRTDLASVPVIESEHGGTWQGYSCSVARLTGLDPNGPTRLAEHIPLAYSDAGAIVDDTKPREVDGTIAQGQRDQSFTVHYKGTVTQDVVYSRKGAGFVAGTGADTIPQC